MVRGGSGHPGAWGQRLPGAEPRGRIANTAVTSFQTLGPVDEVKANGTRVKAATPEELEEGANAFADTAWLVKLAGFDIVMLHGAHGWLLDQMLSPKWNRRTDDFGGDLAHRAKFPLMVIDKVQASVGGGNISH